MKVFNDYPTTREEIHLLKLKYDQRPCNKSFPSKPNERNTEGETRKRTRPWDQCWFSNKPNIISLTVEQAVNQYPDYILWCYNNLSIKWSVHTIRLIEASMNRSRRMTINEFSMLKKEFKIS
jgi:hypothetical protein